MIAFAGQHFSRVALFGVRGDRAVGVAQVGLARAGGPDDAGLRELSLGSREPAWFRRVIEERRPLRAAPTDNGDHRLAVLLGNEIPAEVFVAPIVTGDRVAALLYADNLPGQEPIGDTGALEVAARGRRHRARPRPDRTHARAQRELTAPQRGAEAPSTPLPQRRATSEQKSASAIENSAAGHQELAPALPISRTSRRLSVSVFSGGDSCDASSWSRTRAPCAR